MSDAGLFSRALGLIAEVEPREAKAVVISFVYFFFLLASYFILRPLRDTMGTVYGVAHLQELFTGTFVLSFIVAPIFAGLASRIRLASFLPWVYGFIAITMLVFYCTSQPPPRHDQQRNEVIVTWTPWREHIVEHKLDRHFIFNQATPVDQAGHA